MISKRNPGGVHHPNIRVTQTPLPKTRRLLPGCGHITQHNIYRLSLLLISLLLALSPHAKSPFSIVRVSFKINIAFSVRIGNGSGRRMSIFAKLLVDLEELAFRTSSIGVVQETLDLFLYAFGEEIALDCGYALWGLGGYDVNSYYSSTWLRPFDCNLCPSISVSTYLALRR